MRRTWAAWFLYTGARYLPRPVVFTLRARINRPDGPRDVELELSREDAVKVAKHLEKFLWHTDPNGIWSKYPDGWRGCHCGYPVMDGHLTCGRAECGTQADAEARR